MKKISDSLNTAVFTTKYVMRNNSPIIYVSHDDEGYWLFVGKETNLQDEEYMLVSLDEIIKHDATVIEVADLPRGGEAIRKDENSPWRINSNN
jgi:hypothetical protein